MVFFIYFISESLPVLRTFFNVWQQHRTTMIANKIVSKAPSTMIMTTSVVVSSLQASTASVWNKVIKNKRGLAVINTIGCFKRMEFYIREERFTSNTRVFHPNE